MSLNQKQIDLINKEVYKRFPEVRGKNPQVLRRKLPKTRSIVRSNTYSLTYRCQSKNKAIPYCVRVIVNEEGRILKITMSH